MRVQRLMTVLHSEDADWCVSMTTTEKQGAGDTGVGQRGGGEVERVKKNPTLINPTCPDNNDTNI